MAEVFVTTAADDAVQPYARRDFERLLAFAREDRLGTHTLTDDPARAELVVFVGSARSSYADVRASATFRQYRDRSVIVESRDRCIPLLPGLYTCLERRWSWFCGGWARGGFYLRVADDDTLDLDDPIEDARYLFSFLGNARHHPVRRRLLALDARRALLHDTSGESSSAADAGERSRRYRDALAQSKFVLCPRGIGVSTWRLFETLRAGRVPVIVSDGWVEPRGPDWAGCSVRVRERDAHRLPALLTALEDRAPALAANARAQWQRWFARDVVFTTTVDALLAARDGWRRRNRVRALGVAAQYAEPHFLRHWVLSPLARRIAGR